MSFRERVYSVLIVSAAEKFNTSLMALLSEKNFSPVHFSKNVSDAQRRLLERQYDLILINAPLPDDFGRKLAVDISSGKDSIAGLLVHSDIYSDTCERVMEHGVFTLRKPMSAATLSQSLDLMCAARERLRRLEKKTVTLEDKMAEIRIVNKAKWLLIEMRKMSEADAHRFIEKQAMDRCVTRREIAENILQQYDRIK